MTDDLTEFLRARLDEDERVARAAYPGPWRYNPRKQWHGPIGPTNHQGEEFVGAGDEHTACVAATGPADNTQSMADARHIARHDPARVLAEVDAKRRILDMAQREKEDHPTDTSWDWESSRAVGRNGAWEDVLPLLALPYAAHPDYRDEWSP